MELYFLVWFSLPYRADNKELRVISPNIVPRPSLRYDMLSSHLHKLSEIHGAHELSDYLQAG